MPPYGHRKPIKDRFAPKYHINPITGCWDWTGATAEDRYGVLWEADGRSVYAHRISYVLHKGPIPKGKFVLHTCDNMRCVNPKHLYAGTAKQNSADAKARNRLANQRGERNPNVKLTEAKVRAIRALKDGQLSQEKVSRRFGVSRKTISAIWDGRAWSHIV